MFEINERGTSRSTTNYAMFCGSDDNRPVDLSKRDDLRESMKKYGFITAFPLHTRRQESGRLEVRDGQHRLGIAQELGINVWYTIGDDDIDVGRLHDTSRRWTALDYTLTYIKKGNRNYAEILEFSQKYGISLIRSAALLSGSFTQSNATKLFTSGMTVCNHASNAIDVAETYLAICNLGHNVKRSSLLAAIFACSCVPEFNHNRLRHAATRCRDKLRAYATKEEYIRMLEAIYNYGHGIRIALECLAENAMRARNLAVKKGRMSL